MTLQQKVERKAIAIQSMNQLLNELKENLRMETEEASLLHDNFDGL